LNIVSKPKTTTNKAETKRAFDKLTQAKNCNSRIAAPGQGQGGVPTRFDTQLVHESRISYLHLCQAAEARRYELS
jgi:hypothetical protein